MRLHDYELQLQCGSLSALMKGEDGDETGRKESRSEKDRIVPVQSQTPRSFQGPCRSTRIYYRQGAAKFRALRRPPTEFFLRGCEEIALTPRIKIFTVMIRRCETSMARDCHVLVLPHDGVVLLPIPLTS